MSANCSSSRSSGHRVIGLTGAPGAGKSEAIQYLNSLGIPVLQTDRLGHQLLREKLYRDKLVALFGKEILGVKGAIDRSKLGAVVFKERRAQKRLNNLTHPEIRRRVAYWVKKCLTRRSPPRLVVVEVPLIFEGGYYRWFDGVLCLSATAQRRLSRLTKRGWSVSDARQRENLQWPARKRELMSNWVVRNNGTHLELHRQLQKWLDSIDDWALPRHSKYFGKL